MTNRVDIEVTGTNKFDATSAAVLKEMRKLQTEGAKTSASVKKVTTELDAKPKLDGIKEADKAIKKLADTADEAFDKVKAKLEEGLGEADRERVIKVKAEVDRDRFKNSLDNLGSLDFDFGKIGGGKLTSAITSMFDGARKGAGIVDAGIRGGVDFVNGLSSGIKNQHPYVQAAIYSALFAAVVTVGPFIGAALAGGIVAAFGAGVAGIGIIAAAQADRVQSIYKDLWDGIVRDTKSRAAPIEDVLVRTAQRAQTAWDSIAPALGRSFDKVAPGLEALLDGLLRSMQRFAPALEPIAQAASRVFEDLGSRLPDIIGDMADKFAGLAEIVRENPEALGDFIAAVGDAIEIGVRFIGGLSRMYGAVKDFFDFVGSVMPWNAFDEGEKKIGKTSSSMLALADVSGNTNSKVEGLRASFQELADAEDDAAKRGDAFLEIMNKLNGITPSFDDAVQDANDTVRNLIDNFADGVKAGEGFGKELLNADGSINTMTKNGSLLYDAISGLRENFADMAGATKELEAAGLSHEEAVAKVNAQIAIQSERLLGAAQKMGLNQDQMRELLRLYGLTPEQIETLMKLNDANYRRQLEDALQPRTLWIVPQLTSTGLGVGAPKLSGPNVAHAFGGNVAKAAAGGARNDEVIINDGPGYPGEAVRLPNGSTVWPAGMTNMMMKTAARGYGMLAGGGGGSIVIDGRNASGLDAVFLEWLKKVVGDRGGDPGVFG